MDKSQFLSWIGLTQIVPARRTYALYGKAAQRSWGGLRKSYWNTTLPCLFILLCQPVVVHAGIAGRLQFVTGDVRIQGLDGRQRPAQKGAEVLELESLITGGGGQAQLRMIDGGLIALRPDSMLKMEAYVFQDGNSGEEKAWLSLLKGGLRSITGLIGKRHKENYAIRTPNAVIGIRGTDHEPMVILPDSVLAKSHPSGTYDKVNQGMTSLSTKAGTTYISRNQVGFASAPNAPPQLLQHLPNFYQHAAQPALHAKHAANKGDNEEAEKKEANSEEAAKTTESGEMAKSLRESGAALLTLIGQTGAAGEHQLAEQLANNDSLFLRRVLTAIGQAGAQIDAGKQAIISTDGATNSITLPNENGASPIRLDIVANFAEKSAVTSTELAEWQNQAQQLNQLLSTLNASLQQSGTAQQSALKSSATAAALLQQSQASAQAVSEAGAAANQALLAAAQTFNHSADTALTNANFVLQGEIGLLPAQHLAQLGVQIYQRYQANLTQPASSQLDLAAANDWLGKFGIIQANANGDEIAIASKGAVLQAQNAAQAVASMQAELAKLSRQDPLYPAYLQLANDANASLARLKEVISELQIAQASSLQSLQQVASLGALTLRDTALPTAHEISNGNYAGTLSLVRDAQGNLLNAAALTEIASGNLHQKLYFSTEKPPVLRDLATDASSGLAWGRWQGGQVVTEEMYSDRDAHGNFGLGSVDPASGQFVLGLAQRRITDLGQSSLHWLTGLAASPQRLAQSLTGSASYTMLGATSPTDNKGQIGVLESAKLEANFSAQTVAANLQFSFADQHWEIGDANMPLFGSRFEGLVCDGCPAPGSAGSLAVLNKNGQAVSNTPEMPYRASISGSLMGLGLTSAGLQYSVTEPVQTAVTDPLTGLTYLLNSNHIMQGVVGFVGEKQDIASPFRAASMDDGSLVYNSLAGRLNAPSISASFDYGSPANRLIDNQNGLQELIGTASNFTPDNQDKPVASELAVTLKRGTASNTDLGSARFGDTTVKWGRWENGVVDIYSRDGSSKLGSFNNQGRSLHWVNTSATSDKLASLPITGTASYNLEGGTTPSDMNGNLGTLSSAKVDVDFSLMKANTNLSLFFNTADNVSTWNVEVKNTPLIRGQLGFNTTSNHHGINGESHMVSCVGASCGEQNFSNISAGFIGIGAPGLAFSYDLVSSEKVGKQFTPKANAHGIVILRK